MMTPEGCRDVLVIGGGPAGAAAAIELARQGADVLLVERRSFPRPKVCGGCLGPRAIACLHHLGVDPAGLDGAVRLDRVQLAVGDARAALPLPIGVAVDRAKLDLQLLDRARAAGADVWMQARARIGDAVGSGRQVHVERHAAQSTVTAKFVVLATGLPAAPATAPGARVGLSQTRLVVGVSSAPQRALASPPSEGGGSPKSADPPAGDVWMVSGSRGYIGMVRFADGRLNVAASIRASALGDSSPGARVDEILVEAGLPALRWRDGWTGTPPLRAQPPETAEDRVVAVGDAAGFWEPFTGEGIGWALEAGIAVAPLALELGSAWDRARAASWASERRAWMRRIQIRSRTVAALSGHPRLARAALGLIRRVPAAGRWLIPAAAPGIDTPGGAPGARRGAA